jgi:hypothetical protein
MATATYPGAQTERRGGAGPVRGLLGGKTSPAAFFASQNFGVGRHRGRPRFGT